MHARAQTPGTGTSRTPLVRAALLVVAAAVCFGTTGTAQAIGAPEVDSISLGAARVVLGGLLLALLAVPQVMNQDARRARRLVARMGRVGRFGDAGRPSPDTGARGLPSRRIALPSLVVVVIGALGVAAYQPTFFTGTSENGVAVGTIVALGSAPVLTGVLEWIVTRRAPGIRWGVATAVAAVGVVALAGVFALGGGGAADAGGSAAHPITALGLAGSLGAGAAYALYAVCSKVLLERGWTPVATMGSLFGAAALLMTPVLLSTDLGWLATAPGLVTVLWLAIVTVALAYTLFARGLRSLPAATVSTLTLVEPATATLLGVVVLAEVLTPDSALGVGLLVVAVVVLAVPARASRASAALR